MSDRGALEPVIAFLAGLLALLTVGIVVLVGLRVRIEGVRTAADLAALAAAADGSCAIATVVAARNGAELRSCSLQDGEVRVRVRGHRPTAGPFRAVPEGLLLASAHAGLADVFPQT